VLVSALLLLTVAVVASMLPAIRAARVDVIQALRSE
jgi:putative ABC transport system permease protein